MEARRRLRQLTILTDRPCSLCGNVLTVLMESREARHGLGWVNPFWRADRELFAVCSRCRARQMVDDRETAS